MARKTNWNQGTENGASAAKPTDDRTVGSRSTATGSTVKVSDNTGKDVGTTRVVGSQGTRVSKGGRGVEHGY